MRIALRGPFFKKFPAKFPASREFWGGDRFDPGCIHHHAVVCYRRFPERVRKAPNWRGSVGRSLSETAPLQSAGGFCAFFSGPEIPFPGNGDRKRQRLGSNAGHAEGRISTSPCIPWTGATRSPWNCLSNELLYCSSVQ